MFKMDFVNIRYGFNENKMRVCVNVFDHARVRLYDPALMFGD